MQQKTKKKKRKKKKKKTITGAHTIGTQSTEGAVHVDQTHLNICGSLPESSAVRWVGPLFAEPHRTGGLHTAPTHTRNSANPSVGTANGSLELIGPN